MSSANEAAEPVETPAPPPEKPIKPRAPRSLRVELMVSYLSLLAVVVFGFGGATYAIVRDRTYADAESELVSVLMSLSRELQSGVAISDLTIPETSRPGPGRSPRDHTYLAIWDAHGRQIGGLDPPPHLRHRPSEEFSNRPPMFTIRHGIHVDVYKKEADEKWIMVGRGFPREFDRLKQLAGIVTLMGAVSLGAGAAGAWLLARRIVKPIDQMTQAAEQITAKSLDQPLELVGASSELTRLSTVFNTMLNRLHNAFQRQIRFTADASHELRTPVAVILSQAEHTLSRPRSPEDYCSALDTCLRAARRMKRLVDDLLLLARADSGRLEIRQESVDLADVVRQSLAMLEPLAKEKQVRLSSQLLTTRLIGDAGRLSQVVTNLVTNALQYNRPEGEVFVTVHARESKATLVVSDTGIGIPAGDQPRLFERFFRADQARTHQEGQGTGLGLSIVSEIVAAHHGTIDVTSELGVGTTVTVLLPIVKVAVSSDDL